MASLLFIGLGNMGAPMVRHLASDYDIIVSDVNNDLAQKVADELGGTVDDGGELGVEAVILMLPNSKIVESVITELAPRLPDGALIIDMSSSEPTSTIQLEEAMANRGIDYVDAPVSGGVAKAKTGELAIMCGGTEKAFSRALPILDNLGANVTHVGGPGSGDVAKVLNNLLSATNLAAAAEILSVATKFGIEPETMIEVINNSTGRSQATEVKYPGHILTHTWSSGFAFDLMAKDLRIAHSVAEDTGVDLDITGRTLALTEQAGQEFGPGKDHTELARFIEEHNKISFHREDQDND